MNAAARPLATIWVGLGHAGCRTLASLRRQLPDMPDLAVVHTRAEVLAETGIERAVQLPTGPAGGTGGDPTVGERAAADATGELRALLEGYAVVVLLVGLGGGTGSGAAPAVARLAREAGAFVLALATLPFLFEGPRRYQVARRSLATLQESADAVILVSNQRLSEWVPDGTPLQTAFQMTDHFVGTALRSLWHLLTSPAILPIDLSDLRRVASDHTATLAMASVETAGHLRIESALDELSASPLLDHGAVLLSSPAVLAAVSGGADLTLREVNGLASGLRARIRPDASLTLGAMVDETLADGRIAVTLLAAEPTEIPERPTALSTPARAPVTDAPSSGRRARQAKLVFDSTHPDRFAGVAPTVRDGVNVDVPTYLRRNIRLSSPVRG